VWIYLKKGAEYSSKKLPETRREASGANDVGTPGEYAECSRPPGSEVLRVACDSAEKLIKTVGDGARKGKRVR
jgi:hypothetical protein